MSATAPDPFAPDDRLAKWLDPSEVEEARTLQTDMRQRLDLRDRNTCVGCHLGDASPLMHDYGFGCAYGEDAGA